VLISSGGQVIMSTNELRARGAVVEHAIVVIDRRPTDAGDVFADNGLELRALYTMAELTESSDARR